MPTRTDYTIHYTKTFAQPAHSGPQVATGVIQCRECGFAHLDPLPDAATVARYYEEDEFYSAHSPQDWLFKEKAEHRAWLWDAYYNHLANQLDLNKPVLDFGCGAGWFLEYLWHQRGVSQWQLFGIEPSRKARQASLIGHRLFEAMPGKPGGAHQIKGNIVLSLTLEHIPNPAKFLQDEILPHLDGRLVVVVPSEFNPIQRLVNRLNPKHRDWFVSPVHLNYLTPASLRRLLESLGLRIVYQGATFPMEAFCLIGRNHIGDDEQGRRNHLARLYLEKRWPSAFRLYGWWGRWFGIGREVIMVGEK